MRRKEWLPLNKLRMLWIFVFAAVSVVSFQINVGSGEWGGIK